jgi:alkylhydroperoxidase family enzyme
MDQEPRVRRVDPADADPTLRESFDGFMRARGKVPNLFRIAAHNPPVGRTLSAHLDAVMGPGTVGELLKELCAVRVSQLNGCEY